ncbi:MAG: TenA family transcriptional regulator [Chloroflexota bacterium]
MAIAAPDLTSLSPAEFYEHLFRRVSELDLAHHPTVLAIRGGDIDKQQMKWFLREFFIALPKYAPRVLALLYSQIPYRVAAGREVFENQAEEVGVNSEGHVAHYVQAMEEAGVPRDILVKARPLPETAAMSEWKWRMAASRPWQEAMTAYSYAFEHGALGWAKQISDGLEEHFGEFKLMVDFWKLHSGEVEERHGAVAPAIVKEHVTPDMYEEVSRTCYQTLDFTWLFFEGVRRAYFEKQPGFYERWRY